MSYEHLYKCYDRFVGVDYDDVATLISSVFNSFDISGRVLDIACGTGELTKRLCDKGFEMTGLDISEKMLGIAEGKCNARFIKGDMTEFSLSDGFSAAVCTLDAVNHLESKYAVKSFFRCTYDALKSDGIFVFDINSPYKHKEILSNNTFVFEDEKTYLVWKNEYDGDKRRVNISLDLFTQSNGLYERSSESFYEYDYSIDEIKDMLYQTGFEIINISGGYDMEEIDEYTERYFIIAGKAE